MFPVQEWGFGRAWGPWHCPKKEDPIRGRAGRAGVAGAGVRGWCPPGRHSVAVSAEPTASLFKTGEEKIRVPLVSVSHMEP